MVADRSSFEQFVHAYAGQSVSYSFEWDSREVRRHGDVGWIVAFGREVCHAGEETAAEFRLTLICRRRPSGWRIVHLHASTPVENI